MNQNINNLIPTIIGTAGHIDHGKSSLVKRLTGIDPDRWVEEKKRGMTIDIGFAEMTLPSGKLIGFIDVPGHEKFIKNMVAGATGFGIVLFVVAADDGIMPQSIEHLNIMNLLGIKNGIIVLSKVDLVEDEELIELLHDDIRGAVAGTFLENAPIVDFSATTGQGTVEILNLLDSEIRNLQFSESVKFFRMPVQRVFSSTGFGSVVTGVPSEGEIKVSDEVEIIGAKGRTKTKVRGLQVFGSKVESASCGHRLAINLQGVGTDKLERGDYIVKSGAYRTAKIISAKVKILESSQHNIKNTQSLTAYIGTNKIVCKIVFLSQDKFMKAGQEEFAQLRFEEEIHTCVGDKIIIRDYSNQFLIGGATALKLSNTKPRGKKEHFVDNLRLIESKLENATDLLASYLQDDENSTISINKLIEEFGFKKDYAAKLLDELIASDKVLKEGNNYISTAYFAHLAEILLKVLQAENEQNQFRYWHSKAHILSRMKISNEIGEYVVKYLAKNKQIQVLEGKIQVQGYQLSLSDSQSKLIDQVLKKVQEGGAKPMLATEIDKDMGIKDAIDILEYLVYKGELTQLNKFLFVRNDIVQEMKDCAISLLKEHESFTVAEFREDIDTSRKYALPMLAFLDNIELTRLEGAERVRGSKWDELVK